VTLDEESAADSGEFMSGIRAGMVEEAVLLLRLIPVAHLPGQPRSPVRLRGMLRPVGGEQGARKDPTRAHRGGAEVLGVEDAREDRGSQTLVRPV